MTSGPVMVQVLEGDNAVAKHRDIMGATNPKNAAPGTIRADFADSVEENTVHGSDAADTAKQEIEFFFKTGGGGARARGGPGGRTRRRERAAGARPAGAGGRRRRGRGGARARGAGRAGGAA